MDKALVYYSDGRGDPRILSAVREQLRRVARVRDDIKQVVSVTLQPLPGFFENYVLDLARGTHAMFAQILSGLVMTDVDTVFFVEHDVLYDPWHFDFDPPRRDTVYYDEHVWKVDTATGRALRYWCNQTSGLCADRQLLIDHYRRRVELVLAHGFTRRMGFEPGTRSTRQGGVDDLRHESWRAPVPLLDIRHAHNLTESRWRKEDFRNQRYTAGWLEADAVPGWGVTKGRFWEFLEELSSREVTHV